MHVHTVLLYEKLTNVTIKLTFLFHLDTYLACALRLLDVDGTVDDGDVVLALAAVLQHVGEAALPLLGNHDEFLWGHTYMTSAQK